MWCTLVIHTGHLLSLLLFGFFSFLYLFKVIENQYLWSRTKVVIRVCLDYMHSAKAELNQICALLKASHLHAEALAWWPVWFPSLPQDLPINSAFILAACTQLLRELTDLSLKNSLIWVGQSKRATTSTR